MGLINSISIILFIIILFSIILKHRKKLSFEKIGKVPVAALLRTRFGIPLINKIGGKHSKFLKILGYIGIFIGFAGMIAMFGTIVVFFVKLVLQPAAPAVVSLVIPGVKLPGQQMFFPFWYTIIALFIVVVVHEFGHGVIAKAHKIKIKNTGFLVFLILPGAFVEPSEKDLQKTRKWTQQSVYAAGPWFNVLLTIIVLLIMTFITAPLYNATASNEGFYFTNVDNNSGAQLAGLPTNTTFTQVNNVTTLSVNKLIKELTILKLKPGNNITMTDENNITYPVTLGVHPNNNESAYIGITGLDTVRNHKSFFELILFKIIGILDNLLFWIMYLSLGIGSANLLPIGPFDGGRMLYTFLRKKFKEKTAKIISSKVTILTTIILLALIFVPMIKAMF